jgi:hypothetical protein
MRQNLSMRWVDFERSEPTLADLGRRKLSGPGVVLVVTIRRDGTPRLSPVEPLFWDGSLSLSMGWRSRKAADLDRDPRVLVHNVVTDREGTAGEYKVRGRAYPESDLQLQRDYAETVSRELGWQPEPGKFHLFRVDVEDVTFIRWDPLTNDQYVTRWPDTQHFVRRGTSPTSLTDAQPIDRTDAYGDP